MLPSTRGFIGRKFGAVVAVKVCHTVLRVPAHRGASKREHAHGGTWAWHAVVSFLFAFVAIAASRDSVAADADAGKAEQEAAAKEAARQEALEKDVTQGACASCGRMGRSSNARSSTPTCKRTFPDSSPA